MVWWICCGGAGGKGQQYDGQVGAHIGAVQLYPQGIAPLFSVKKTNKQIHEILVMLISHTDTKFA